MAYPVIHTSLELVADATGSVTYPAGGSPVAWTLPAGHYTDYHSLALALRVLIQFATGDANWTVSVNGYGAGGLTLARGGAAFDAVIPAALQAHVGWTTPYQGVTSATGTAPAPGALVLTLPLGDPDVHYVHRRHWSAGDDVHSPLVSVRGTVTRFSATLHYEAENLDQLRVVWPQLIRGRQFRLYSNPADLTAWTESNRDGYLDLRLDANSYRESWTNEPAATLGSLPIEAVVV